MPTTIHIGYDDHISGFQLKDSDLTNLLSMSEHDEVNQYIVGNCERIETNDADLFFNMMDESMVEFEEFIDNVRFWLEEG